ncbi:MAG TPA: DNA polymerase III subunit delta [Solirubrobacteraceae bacterium]|jgi:DNA polymerase-3 subunit delta|nr:DNA polymerase III subunit delta [Solirubrobacteraceae bacterium]
MPPSFKPAYLIHGDDHGRIAERRARLRDLAEKQSGANGFELFEGDQATPDNVAAALNAMTFAIGRRFVIVDGAERWKDKEMDALEAALAGIACDTTVTFFAREDGRLKAPKRLHEAVKKSGGDISTEQAVKPWELPKWAVAQAKQLGLDLTPEAARMLVGHVGERQQRLLRELEKLALEFEPNAHIDADTVLESTAGSAERKAWALADALLSGSTETATRTLLQMRAQGERVPGLIYWMSSRVRQAHQVARALDRGESQAQVKSSLRMPPSAADKLIADARRIGAERLERATCLIADLELASRGGGQGGASEDTEALLTISAIATTG